MNDAAFAKLLGLLQYIDGDYQDPKTFEQLRDRLGNCTHPTHYLAIPPSLFGEVVGSAGALGLRSRTRAWSSKSRLGVTWHPPRN